MGAIFGLPLFRGSLTLGRNKLRLANATTP